MRDVFLDPDGIVDPAYGSPTWPKACAGCAFRRHDPQALGADAQADMREECAGEWLEFYCVHRKDDDGLHRICASAGAIVRGARTR